MSQHRADLDGTAKEGRSVAARHWALAVALSLVILSSVPRGAEGARTSPHGAPGQKSICLDCHDPHKAGFTRLLRFPTGDEVCWACHDHPHDLFSRDEYEASPHFRGLGGQPGPVTAPGTPPAPAEDEEDAAQPARPPTTATCARCHQPHGRVAGPKLLRTGQGSAGGAISAACAACHPAYRQVRHGTGECIACHDPHVSTNPGLLRAPREAICYPCHPKPAQSGSLWTGEKSFRRSVHAEVCLGCHNPHGEVDPRTGAVYPKSLVESGAALCLRCHSELGERFTRSQRASAAAGVRSRHPADQPVSTVRCLSCHNPHQVRAKVPGGAEPVVTDPRSGKLYAWLGGANSVEFCLKCHDGSWPGAANIAAEAATGGAVVSGFVWVGKGVNLHYVHLARYHKQKCSDCHDPHATEGTSGINRGHLLTGLTVTDYRGGYPGYEACTTGCHHVRCASCHPAPPDWSRGPSR